METAKKLSDDDLLLMMASQSVNVFIELLLSDEAGKPLKQAAIHEDMQDFMDKNKRGVIIFPREHGKTTQMLGRLAFIIGRNPNIRIKIVSSSDNIATARVKALRQIVESPIYKGVFPDIEPGREWSDSKFTVKRSIISPEPTVEGFGISSRATGGRADDIEFDDPDDEEVVFSEARRKRNVERLQNVWLNLLTPDGVAFILCTPWHSKDIASTQSKEWPVLRFPVTGMNSIWPQRWPVEVLEVKKKEIGSLAFARGFELIPQSTEDAPIKGEWFKFWHTMPEITQLAIPVDLAISQKATADYTCIGIVGKDKQNNAYLLGLVRKKLDFPSTLNEIIQVAQRAQEEYKLNPIIGIEDVAYQKAVPQTLKKACPFPIISLKADGSKFFRASRFAVHVENGRVWLKGSDGGNVHPDQAIVFDECTAFPMAAHDDTVDMLGYGVEMVLTRSRPTPLAFSGRRK